MEILTPWVLDSVLGYVPLLYPLHFGGFTDTTGQRVFKKFPEPNLVVIEYTDSNNKTSLIELDSEFFILSDEVKKEQDIPDLAEFGQLRSYLAQQKMPQSFIDEAIGGAPKGRTRKEITEELKDWLRILT